MYELKKIGKVFTSKFVGTGPSSYEKKNLPGRGLTDFEKHGSKPPKQSLGPSQHSFQWVTGPTPPARETDQRSSSSVEVTIVSSLTLRSLN